MEEQGTLAPPETPPNAPPDPPPAKPEQHKRAWASWEVGAMLNWLSRGRPIKAVASRLDRTAVAVSAHLDRLLDGSVQCPESHEAKLEAVRKRLCHARSGAEAARRKAESRDPHAARYKVLGAGIEAVSKAVEETRTLHDETRRLQLVCLAVEVAGGIVLIEKLERVLGPSDAAAVARLADHLTRLEWPPDLVPVVSIGQGTSRRDWHGDGRGYQPTDRGPIGDPPTDDDTIDGPDGA